MNDYHLPEAPIELPETVKDERWWIRGRLAYERWLNSMRSADDVARDAQDRHPAGRRCVGNRAHAVAPRAPSSAPTPTRDTSS